MSMHSQSKMLHQSVLDMVAHLVLIPKLFRTCRDSIKESYFRPSVPEEDLMYGEIPLKYIWLGLINYYDNQSEVAPTKSLLIRYVLEELEKHCEDDAGLRDVLVSEDTNGYIRYIYDPDRASFNVTSGMPLIKKFLMERDVSADFSAIANKLSIFDGTTDAELDSKIADLSARAERIKHLGVQVSHVPSMPDDDYFLLDNGKLMSTHWDFLDGGLGGGQRRGEVYGIIGATGAGKTTLGMQILVGNSVENRAEALQGGTPELCIYYTYEQSASQLLPRLQSCGCKIARSSLIPDPITHRLPLSRTPDERKTYEKYLWPDSDETELDRWRNNAEWFNNYTIVQNMSGIPDLSDVTEEQKMAKRSRGHGGIPEIQNDVEQLIEETGCNVRSIVIDYAGLVAQGQYGCEADSSVYISALARMGDMCRKQLAGRFNCPVWLMHQLSGVGNAKSPIDPPHHSSAQGCKTFGDNMDTCICLGTPDNGSDAEHNSGKCLYLVFSKTRNVGGNGFDAMNKIVQHDDYFYQLNDVTDLYVPNRQTRGFVRKRQGRYLE